MDAYSREARVTDGERSGWQWQMEDGTTRGLQNRKVDPERFDTGALAARIVRAAKS